VGCLEKPSGAEVVDKTASALYFLQNIELVNKIYFKNNF
jgi:hypothetical protein